MCSSLTMAFNRIRVKSMGKPPPPNVMSIMKINVNISLVYSLPLMEHMEFHITCMCTLLIRQLYVNKQTGELLQHLLLGNTYHWESPLVHINYYIIYFLNIVMSSMKITILMSVLRIHCLWWNICEVAY